MLLLNVEPVHRRVFLVLSYDLRASEVKVTTYHLQSCMTEYFLKRIDITTIKQIVDGKGVSAQVSM